MPKVSTPETAMPEVLRERRKRLMRHLLRNKRGATIDEIARAIGVTRTAVRQHLASLMQEGLVAAGETRPTGGRPERLFMLTPQGREEFPRRYSWFAQLLIEAIEREHGKAGLRVRLGRIAAAVVTGIRQGVPATGSRREKVEALSALMDELGYDARTARDLEGAPTIEADNCVFHELAARNPEVCHFDLALLSGYTGSKVTLHECMARGGHVCRFQFKGQP
jgi:predicted ArsR family transcriptional regulator